MTIIMYCCYRHCCQQLFFIWLSLLCREFTIVYLKQATFLGYIVLQLFCVHNYGTCGGGDGDGDDGDDAVLNLKLLTNCTGSVFC